MIWTIPCAVVLTLGLMAGVSSAQTVPRWDVTGTTGLFAGGTTTDDLGGYHEDWFQALQGGVILGRHLSPHLKVEFELAATTSGTRYIVRAVTSPSLPSPYWLSSDATTSARSLGASAVWQFRNNEWVHPFVQAGVSTDFDHVRLVTPRQFYYGDSRGGQPPRVVSEERIEESTTRHIRGLVGAGAKLYFRERAFVRTDGRLTFDRDQHNLAFRVGVGIDF